ncbi:hypothetical protein KTE26_14380 [Ralstonia mannitolilytica]|uniref:DUF7940 domain-containing protein n=1 Tax=Ralstonia mannitolilytica TaxID=105219 RepID=UPI001C21D3C4|nr:hypothetical protein [Ralstonia mannitolilytica]MBU9579618.1 hypothetical protein [Ralstonia mannitolilytica]
MNRFLIDKWSTVCKWWSMWAGIVVAVVLTGVPIVADQWPQLAPTFVALFPKHGEQWAPVVGVILMIIARLLNQAAVLEGFRRLFHRNKDTQP